VTGSIGGEVRGDRDDTVLFSTAGISSFVARVSADGATRWFHAYGGNGFDWARDAVVMPDSIAIAGTFSGDVDFDPSERVHVASCPGKSCAYLLFLSHEGRFQAVTIVGGEAGGVWVGGATAMGADVVIVGWYVGTIGFAPSRPPSRIARGRGGYAVRIDRSGNRNLLFASDGEGFLSFASAVAANNGRLYIGGNFAGNFAGSATGQHGLTAVGRDDGIVLAIDAAAGLLWSAAIGSSDFDSASSLTLTPTGDLLVVGYAGPDARLSGATSRPLPKPAQQGKTALATLRLSPNGELLGAAALGGTDNVFATASCLTARGLFVGGKFNGSVDFDGDASTPPTVAQSGATRRDADAFVVQYAADLKAAVAKPVKTWGSETTRSFVQALVPFPNGGLGVGQWVHDRTADRHTAIVRLLPPVR
jgi:hypothetical protein